MRQIIDTPVSVRARELRFHLVSRPQQWIIYRRVRAPGRCLARAGTAKRNAPRQAYAPTLAQIAAATAKIRAAWTAEEFEFRWTGVRRVLWNLPEVKASRPELRIYRGN